MNQLTLTNMDDVVKWRQQCAVSNRSVGSLHTLGDLHIGHAELIKRSASENDETLISIYPNKAQLIPGAVYEFDLEADLRLARKAGATCIVAPSGDEMYPPSYSTYLDQGDCYSRMDATVVPFLFRGMITMSFRWVNFVRPTKTYWGMKDIAQTLLVSRAIKDMLVPTDVIRVPCVRDSSGIPVSSRLKNISDEGRSDVSLLYSAVCHALQLLKNGLKQRDILKREILNYFDNHKFKTFKLRYFDVFSARDFSFRETIKPPFIIHAAISGEQINHFDGILINSNEDLARDQETITVNWLEQIVS